MHSHDNLFNFLFVCPCLMFAPTHPMAQHFQGKVDNTDAAAHKLGGKLRKAGSADTGGQNGPNRFVLLAWHPMGGFVALGRFLFRPHHRVSWLCSSVCADIHCLSREAQREIRAERPRTVQLQHTIPKPDDSSSSAYSLPSSRESLTLSTTCESWGNGWQVHFLPMKRKRRAHYWEVLVKVSDRL